MSCKFRRAFVPLKLISAPTGSGKTTIFDLAFLRMLHAEPSLLEYESRTTYAIYLAPTKASDIFISNTDL